MWFIFGGGEWGWRRHRFPSVLNGISSYICKDKKYLWFSRFFKSWLWHVLINLELPGYCFILLFPRNLHIGARVRTHTRAHSHFISLANFNCFIISCPFPSLTSPAPTEQTFLHALFCLIQMNIPNNYYSAAAPAGKRHHPIYLSLLDQLFLSSLVVKSPTRYVTV